MTSAISNNMIPLSMKTLYERPNKNEISILNNIHSYLTQQESTLIRSTCKPCYTCIPPIEIHLDYSNSFITGDNLANIFAQLRHANVTSIKLQHNGGCLPDECLEPLRAFKNLKYLDLSRNRCITNKGLSYLNKLPLNYLDLSSTMVTGKGFVHLKDLPLTNLTISQIYITDEDLAYLSDLPLTHLELYWTGIRGDGLSHLSKLPLTYLGLGTCGYLSDRNLAHLKKLPLQELSLLDSYNITDEGLKHLKDMTSITDLNLGGCREVTDKGLIYLKKFPLKQLQLSGTSTTARGLFANLIDMPSLILDDHSPFKDDTLRLFYLTQYFKNNVPSWVNNLYPLITEYAGPIDKQ